MMALLLPYTFQEYVGTSTATGREKACATLLAAHLGQATLEIVPPLNSTPAILQAQNR